MTFILDHLQAQAGCKGSSMMRSLMIPVHRQVEQSKSQAVICKEVAVAVNYY